jgi:UDP-glucose 4-epimerase
MVATPSGQTILVTGGSGFVGRHLVTALAPDNRVLSLQRRIVPREQSVPGVEYVYHDLLSLSASDLPAGIDLVIHQAVLIDDPGTPRDPPPMELFHANVTATLSLLLVARELRIPRFVHGSSGSVYGASATPSSEDTPLRPSNAYGLSKRLAEELVQWYSADFQSATVLRYGTPIGRWCSNALLRSFLQHVTDGTPIDLGASRGTLFNPIAVSDLVRLTQLAAGLDGSHVFNVGGVETLSFEDVARQIAAALGRAAVFVESSAPDSPPRQRMMRSDRIRTAVGSTHDRPVSEAVAELAQWWTETHSRST